MSFNYKTIYLTVAIIILNDKWRHVPNRLVGFLVEMYTFVDAITNSYVSKTNYETKYKI